MAKTTTNISLQNLTTYDNFSKIRFPLQLQEIENSLICFFTIPKSENTDNRRVAIKWSEGSNIIYWGDQTAVGPNTSTHGVKLYPESGGNYKAIMVGNITTLPSYSFSYNSPGGIDFRITGLNLKSIIIPDTVINIEQSAFYTCTSLTNIVIPKNVTSIGNTAFSTCSSLKNIELKCTVPPVLGTGVFADTIEKIIVPIESVEAYKTATNWSYYADKIVGVVDTNYLDEKLANVDTSLNISALTARITELENKVASLIQLITWEAND